MKIALISHEGGGISSVTRGLAESLAQKKIYTTIFTGVTNSRPNNVRLNEYLDISQLPIPNFPPRNLFFQINNSQKLLNSFKEYSLIHGMSQYASFGFTFFKKKIRKPFVSSIHGSHRISLKAFVNQPISSWTLREIGYFFLELPLYDFSEYASMHNSDHITCCSFSLLDEIKTYRNLDMSKISVIYNGIDLKRVDSIDEPLGNKENDYEIIFAGRLYWVKGIMYLLEAFKLLKNEIRNVHLSIYGKGPLEGRINEFLSDSGLNDDVSCLGHVPPDKLLAAIKRSDVVVFPSLCEAQSMFMLEAMACKKPLLTFNLPFAREVIVNMENGLMAKAGDVQDLSDKLQMLLLDEKLRSKLGRNAYDYVKKRHNWDVQVEKYQHIYEKLLYYI